MQEYDKKTGIATVEQRNKMFVGDEIEVVRPKGKYFKQKIAIMKNEEGKCIDCAPHPKMIVNIPMEQEVERFTMLRRKKV